MVAGVSTFAVPNRRFAGDGAGRAQDCEPEPDQRGAHERGAAGAATVRERAAGRFGAGTVAAVRRGQRGEGGGGRCRARSGGGSGARDDAVPFRRRRERGAGERGNPSERRNRGGRAADMTDDSTPTTGEGMSTPKKVAAGAAVGVAIPAAVTVAKKLLGDDEESSGEGAGAESGGGGQSRSRSSSGSSRSGGSRAGGARSGGSSGSTT